MERAWKKWFIGCIVVISLNKSLGLWAQSGVVKVHKGNALRIPRGAYASFLVGDAAAGLLYVNSGASYGLNMHAVDPQQMQVAETPMTGCFQQQKKYTCIDQVVALKHHYYWFLNAWDEHSPFNKLSSWQYDLKSKQVVSGEIPVLESEDLEDGWSGTNTDFSHYRSPFAYHLSSDSSKLLISYRLLSSLFPTGKERLGLRLFDENMQLLLSIEQDMPYPQEKMEILDMLPDSQGTIYILARVSNQEAFVKEKIGNLHPNYHFEIFKYNKAGEAPEVVLLDPGATFPLSFQLSVNPWGEVVCFGYCSENPLSWKCQQLYVFRLPYAPMSIADVERRFYRLPEDVIDQYEKPKPTRCQLRSKGPDAGVF